MTNVINISSGNDERILFYKDLNYTPRLHTEKNVFIAEGTKCVKKLLKSTIEIQSILTSQKHSHLITDNYRKDLIDFEIYLAEKELIDQIIGFNSHEAIYAIGKIPEFTALENFGNKICLLNGIINSENVGAIVRNAVAFDIDSIIFDSKSSSPYLRRAVRVSMGTVFFAKIFNSTDLINDIAKLKQYGYKIVAVEQTQASIPINQYCPAEKECYIFGTESKGIEPWLIELSDIAIEIPINSVADSLNAAACSAVVFNKLI